MAASTEWASQGMVVCLTVGMTLMLKECPVMAILNHITNYLMAASTEWASQGMVVCLTVGMTLMLKECPLMAIFYHVICLPYGSQHRVSLARHGSVSHSRDDPHVQRMPRRGRGMSIPCTQNIRDATGTGKYTLGAATVLLEKTVVWKLAMVQTNQFQIQRSKESLITPPPPPPNYILKPNFENALKIMRI